MSKRLLAVLTGAVMIASALIAAPAMAADVPAEPNIVDPVNDANFINEGTAPGLGHDNVTPADASTVGDLLAVWFSNTDSTVSVHFQTQAAPPASNGVTYQAYASPGEGSVGKNTLGCLRFLGNIPGSLPGGGSYQDKPFIRMVDRCNVGTSIFNDSIEGEFVIEEGPDRTGITTFTFPRDYSPLLAAGQTLTTPTARSSSPTVGDHTNVGFVTTSVDTTKPGTDYAISSGGSSAEEEPKEEPPGKNDPPGKGKKKGCGKGKGKQKGACPGKKPGKPKKPADSCAPYVPGEMGAEAETTIVTDAATEEEPIEIEVPLGPAGGAVGPYDTTTRMKHNVQIDSKGGDVGLFARLESPITDDPDLYVYWPNGSRAAVAGGFNLTPYGPFDGTGNGGHSEMGAEQIDGLRTADCQGWTLDLVNWLGQGGKYKLKLWFGEIQNEPKAPGAEQRVAGAAAPSFYDFLMSF